MFGAQERIRTSTSLRTLDPESSASASSATWAHERVLRGEFIVPAHRCVCQRALLSAVCTQTERHAQPSRWSDLVGAALFTFLVKGADFRLIANVFSSSSDLSFVE